MATDLKNTILEKLNEKTLTSIVIERKYLAAYDEQSLPEKFSKRIYDRDASLGLIKRELKKQTIMQFTQSLRQDELTEWTKGIDESVLTSRDLNNPTNSAVMKKRLKEQLEKDGLRKYIKSAEPSRPLLRSTLDTFAAIKTESKDRTELVKMLFKQLQLSALESILLELSVKTLQQMVVDSGLSIKSTAKNTLVRHLVEMKDYVPTQKNYKADFQRKKPEKYITKKKVTGDENKENDPTKPNPIYRMALRNLELVWDSDDSDEFDIKKYKNTEMEISIESGDDGEKHPPESYDSEDEYYYEDSSESFNNVSDEEESDDKDKKKKRKKGRSKRNFESDDEKKKRKRHHSKKHHRKHHKKHHKKEGKDGDKEKTENQEETVDKDKPENGTVEKPSETVTEEGNGKEVSTKSQEEEVSASDNAGKHKKKVERKIRPKDDSKKTSSPPAAEDPEEEPEQPTGPSKKRTSSETDEKSGRKKLREDKDDKNKTSSDGKTKRGDKKITNN